MLGADVDALMPGKTATIDEKTLGYAVIL